MNEERLEDSTLFSFTFIVNEKRRFTMVLKREIMYLSQLKTRPLHPQEPSWIDSRFFRSARDRTPRPL